MAAATNVAARGAQTTSTVWGRAAEWGWSKQQAGGAEAGGSPRPAPEEAPQRVEDSRGCVHTGGEGSLRRREDNGRRRDGTKERSRSRTRSPADRGGGVKRSGREGAAEEPGTSVGVRRGREKMSIKTSAGGVRRLDRLI